MRGIAPAHASAVSRNPRRVIEVDTLSLPFFLSVNSPRRRRKRREEPLGVLSVLRVSAVHSLPQNSTLAPNCTLRGAPAPLIWPKVLAPSWVAGRPKCGVLKPLKASARNCIFTLSLNRKTLDSP